MEWGWGFNISARKALLFISLGPPPLAVTLRLTGFLWRAGCNTDCWAWISVVDSVNLGWGHRSHISDKFPADASSGGTLLWEPTCYSQVFQLGRGYISGLVDVLMKSPCFPESKTIAGPGGKEGWENNPATGVATQGQMLNSDRSTLRQRPATKEKCGHHQKNKRPQHREAVLNVSFENPLNFSGFNKKLEACPWSFGQVNSTSAWGIQEYAGKDWIAGSLNQLDY